MFRRATLAALFFASGASSLVYQVVWQRILTQEIGIDAISAALIVATFMFGLGVGGALGGWIVRRARRAVRILAAIELLVGVYGFISISLLRNFNREIIPSQSLETQIVLNGLVLLIPIIAMGATGPLMVSAWEKAAGNSVSIGYAYGANVLGAAIGIVAGGFYLIGSLGLSETTTIVASVDVALALVFALLSATEYPSADEDIGRRSIRFDRATKSLSAAAFFIGFAALAYEICYFRLFTTYFGVVAYVFPALIFAYLVNMAFGTWLSDRLYRPERKVLLIVCFVTATIILTLPIIFLQPLLEAMTRQDALVLDPTLVGAGSSWFQIIICLLMSIVLMLPISAISGLFPILVRLVSSQTATTSGASFAIVYFVQTIGNTAGAIVTAFVLFPTVGVVGALGIAGALLGLCAIGFLYHSPSTPLRVPVLAGLGGLVIAWVAFSNTYDFNRSVKYYMTQTNAISPSKSYESVHGLTMFYDRGIKPNENFAAMASGRFYITGVMGSASEASEYPAATEALAYSINPKIRNILFIGLGTVHELLTFEILFPGSHVTVVEINPDLVQGIRDLGHPEMVKALDAAELHINDGRRYLQSIGADKKFDYIHIGVQRATASGTANLFSSDFLRVAKEHLASNGVMTFYGYPNVVSGALKIFGDVAVYGVSNDITETTVVSEPNGISSLLHDGTFAKNFRNAVNLLNKGNSSVIENGGPFAGYGKPGWYLTKDEIESVLSSIVPATDDILATEYYLNQQTSVIPARSKSGVPVDSRGWGHVHNAHQFPFPDASQYVITRDPIFDLGSKDHPPFFINRSEDSAALMIVPDQVFRVAFQSLWRSPGEKLRSWQWDADNAAIGFKIRPGKAYLLKITATKNGSGRWGAKAYCLKGDVVSSFDVEETESPREQTMQAFISPGSDQECHFAMTFDEVVGLGRRSEIHVKNIQLLELTAQAR